MLRLKASEGALLFFCGHKSKTLLPSGVGVCSDPCSDSLIVSIQIYLNHGSHLASPYSLKVEAPA